MKVKTPNPVSPALQRALNYYHSIPELAMALGIKIPAVYQWRSLPKARAYQLESITKGKLKAAKLLADNEPPALPNISLRPVTKRRSEGVAANNNKTEEGEGL